jgi:hypothetical protein
MPEWSKIRKSLLYPGNPGKEGRERMRIRERETVLMDSAALLGRRHLMTFRIKARGMPPHLSIKNEHF